MRGLGGEEFGDAAGFVGDFSGEGVAVEGVQGLGQVFVGGAFAFADAGPPRLGEGVEEIGWSR